MTAADRERISNLYHRALERPPGERAAFLNAECDGDTVLRQEVESLLGYESGSAGFLEIPAALAASDRAEQPDKSQMIGRQLGPYAILSPLGAGGMGEVYRARDSKLGRDVAIKILPKHFTSDPERRARFAREARLLATLNHPNIGAIHGLEETDGVTALVLELVEGRTLADRLERGPLPIAEALTIARQIVDALDAAHEKGIVHRDLKPANIVLQSAMNAAGVLSHDVRAKVLDFGLAKTMAVGLHGDLTQRQSSLDGTEKGRILGTPAYMSPEQARGQAVDKRTDIWAFGCVLYEMLTGRRAFEGDTVTDTLVRVLEREPDWAGLPPAIPEHVRRLLRRCLQKDPGRRARDIGDVRLELDEVPDGPPQTPAPRGRRWWALGLAALVIAALGVSSGRFLPRSDPARVLRPQQLTDFVGLEETPALSPDGQRIAFTAAVNGKRQVFVQALEAGGNPPQITFDDADHQFPRWTGLSSIVYFSPASPGDTQGTLHEISALGGGEPRKVVSSMGGADVRMTDRRLTYFRLADRKIELVTANLDGSNVHVVAPPFDPTGGFYTYPRWSPDGERIAYQHGINLIQEIYIVAAGGGKPEPLTSGAKILNGLAWLPDGSGLVCSSSRDDTMLYLPTARLWHVNSKGEMRLLTSGEVSYVHPDVGGNGTVVASRLDLKSDVFTFPTDGTPQANTEKRERLTFQTGRVVTPTAGPDDREVAFVWDHGGHANIWAIDVASRKLRQVTVERDPNVAVGVPVWSPTGSSIAYVSSGALPGEYGIWLVNPDGSGKRRLVSPGVAPAWLPGGKSVYYTQTTPEGLFRIPTEGEGQQTTVRTDKLRNLIGSDGTTVYMVVERTLVDGLPVLQIGAAAPETGPFRPLNEVSVSRVPTWQILNPTLSPDGKRIAMPLTDGFSTNIWALSTSTGEWRQITDFGGRPTFIARRVSWSWDGRSILAAVAEGDADIFRLDGLLPAGRE